MKLNLINKFKEYFRVLKVSKKPEREELLSTFKISMIGIGLIGAIGFILYLLSYYLSKVGIL